MLNHITLALITLFAAFPAMASVEVGKLAPNFTGADAAGANVTLEQFRGKNVVLEWTNPECPFVVKHYSGGHMQALQQELTADGTIWLSINSSGEGKQGHLTAEQAQAVVAEKNIAATHYLLDPSGEIGKLYDAKTTPHMFIINAEGILVYAGAIDSIASFNAEDIDKAENYIGTNMQALKKGETITTAETTPYGCSVKYKN